MHNLEVDVLQVRVEAAVQYRDGHLPRDGTVPLQPRFQQGEDLVESGLLHLLLKQLPDQRLQLLDHLSLPSALGGVAVLSEVVLLRHHSRENGREARLEQGAPRGLRYEGRDPDQLEGGAQSDLLVGNSPRIVLGRKKKNKLNKYVFVSPPKCKNYEQVIY